MNKIQIAKWNELEPLKPTYALVANMARACGHTHLNQFCLDNLTTWNREMAHLTGVAYGGVSLT